MRKSTKVFVIYIVTLSVSILLAVQLAQAQESYDIEVIEETDSQVIELDQEELDTILAPIALYPDSLLSHIFVASTLPLEVVQAIRWRAQHADLTAQQALEKVEEEDWDPSVKALVAFPDLLSRIDQDLDWLAALGEAFISNEGQVLTSVQSLREKAYALGNLQDNDYIEVVEQDEQIFIQPVEKEVVYVPYYDTRVVYGDWWHRHAPYYWHRPANYYWYAGFYWSPRIYVRPYYFDFGRVHWRNRHVTINHPYHYKAYRHKHNRSFKHKGYVHWRKQASNHKRKHRQHVRSREYQANRVEHRQVKQRLASHQKSYRSTDKGKKYRQDVIKQSNNKQTHKVYKEQRSDKSDRKKYSKYVTKTSQTKQRNYANNKSSDYKRSDRSYKQSSQKSSHKKQYAQSSQKQRVTKAYKSGNSQKSYRQSNQKVARTNNSGKYAKQR